MLILVADYFVPNFHISLIIFFLSIQASNKCSHDCFQIDDEFHCKCPDQMYLHVDGKNCLPFSRSIDNNLKETVMMVNQPTFKVPNQETSSTLKTVIVCILIISLSAILISVLNYAMKKKKKRNNRLDYSKENILDNNKRLIDFGYSLSNVENSILYDRSVAGASSALNESEDKLENQSLTNPPPSPEASFKFDFKFDHDNLRFVSGREDSTINGSAPNLIDIEFEKNKDDSYLIQVPPSSPINSSASLYNERNSDLNSLTNYKTSNETIVDYTKYLNNDYNNSSFLNINLIANPPPNSPSNSISNLKKL